MSDSTHQAIVAADRGLDTLLANIPDSYHGLELREKLYAATLNQFTSTPATKGELGLCGLLACALARLKELERL